jgi:hypothetical protein
MKIKLKSNRIWWPMFAAAAFMITSAGSMSLAAQHEHGSAAGNGQERTLKVGKTGEITLDTETKAGDITLKPGRYRFQHRAEGADHFVHFTEWTKQSPYRPGETGTPKADQGEVKCRLEPMTKKVSQTRLTLQKEEGGYRLVRAEVAGETAAHLF